MSAFTEAVERGLKGLEHVSTGACCGCHECGLDDEFCDTCDGHGAVLDGRECADCHGTGIISVRDRAPGDKLIEMAESPHFSWSPCDCCGSHLGGDRHPAHGIANINGKETLIHLDV